MHRFYIEENIEINNTYNLNKEESHHAIKVLRLNTDDDIEILDGKNTYKAIITDIQKNCVTIKITSLKESVEPQSKITLYQGYPKGDKLYTIVQKCSEVGVSKIVPTIMKRSVKLGNNKEKVISKCKKLSIEASKQSGSNHILEVTDITTYDKILKMFCEHDIIIVPWEEEKTLSLNDAIKNIDIGMNIGIVIGPEGGITNEEINEFVSQGAKTVTFGKRILRCETAGVCAAFAILTGINDL